MQGYTLIDVLGRGAVGTVHRAEDRRHPGRVVALKRIPGGRVARTAIEQEVAALTRLAHPSIVRVLDVVEDEDGAALVTPFLPGGSLADRITRRGPLPVSEVADLGARVGDALAAAHDAGVIHRDVKPANILYDAEEQPLLTDFGAALLDRYSDGWVVGSATYLDPAVAVDCAEPDTRSDQYSLAVTLYEALAGVPPYAASTVEATLRAADRGVHVPLTSHAPHAPSALCEAIERSLSRAPEERFPTVRELASRLAELHLHVTLGEDRTAPIWRAGRTTLGPPPPPADLDRPRASTLDDAPPSGAPAGADAPQTSADDEATAAVPSVRAEGPQTPADTPRTSTPQGSTSSVQAPEDPPQVGAGEPRTPDTPAPADDAHTPDAPATAGPPQARADGPRTPDTRAPADDARTPDAQATAETPLAPAEEPRLPPLDPLPTRPQETPFPAQAPAHARADGDPIDRSPADDRDTTAPSAGEPPTADVGSPGGRSPISPQATTRFGPAPPRPAVRPAAQPSPRQRRRWPVLAAVFVGLVPLAVVAALVWGPDGGPSVGDDEPRPIAGPQEDPPAEDGRPPQPRCDDAPPPPAEGQVWAADLDGSGCTVPITWDAQGQVLAIPTADGASRFRLGQPGDQLLIGAWECEGDAPALYRPATGQVFTFGEFGDPGGELESRPAEDSGVLDGTARVERDDDGCDRVEVTPS